MTINFFFKLCYGLLKNKKRQLRQILKSLLSEWIDNTYENNSAMIF